MLQCYETYRNEAQISYTPAGSSNRKVQETNVVKTKVYSISLPFSFDFSQWSYKGCKWQRNNCIKICNDNMLKLCDIKIKIYFGEMYAKFSCFQKSNKCCKYKVEDHHLIIYLKSLNPEETFYMAFQTTGCLLVPDMKETLKVELEAKIERCEGEHIEFCRSYFVKY